MEINKLIEKLTQLRDLNGAKEVTFNVTDYYSHWGHTATMYCDNDSAHNAKYHAGTFTHSDGHCRIDLSLDKEDGKNPKITYRK